MNNGPGKVLQQARKKKRYSIDRVYKATKIKREFIEALENDEPSVFPAELYYKNFLRTYAHFLALDANEIIEIYEQSKLDKLDDLFKQNHNHEENKFVEFYNKNKKIFVYLGYFIIVIILIYATITLISKKQVINDTNDNIIISTSTTVIPEVIAQQKEQQIEQQIEQKLYIKASLDTWIKIIGDNQILFEGTLSKGNTFETKAKQEFNIKIGNVEGLQVYFNDELVDISKGASNNKVNTINLKKQ